MTPYEVLIGDTIGIEPSTVAPHLHVLDGRLCGVRQAEYTQRTLAVLRTPEGKSGSHVLAYANTAGATESNALYGTPDEICAMLKALAGGEYVLLTISGGKEQLQRFAHEIMPEFSNLQSQAAQLAPTLR